MEVQNFGTVTDGPKDGGPKLWDIADIPGPGDNVCGDYDLIIKYTQRRAFIV